MSDKKVIRLRPHHLACLEAWRGKGYNPKFDANTNILHQQTHGDHGQQTVIEITQYADDMCQPCNHRQGKLCDGQEKIQQLDDAHAKLLGIKPGDTMTWGQAEDLLVDKLTSEAFEQVCAPCGWKNLGICARAHAELRQRKGKA